MSESIQEHIKQFVQENVLGGNTSIPLNYDTPLISSRLVDSIMALKLVSDLEATYNIEFEAHEVTQDNLETINTIAAFVQSKMK